MGATIGLPVQAHDVDDPDLLHPLGNQVHLGADQVWIRESLPAGHPDDLRRISAHQLLVEDPLDFTTELLGDPIEFEVHASGAGVHVPPGHLGIEIPIDDARQRMEGRVGAHDPVATIPVDLPEHRGPGLREHVAFDLVGNHAPPPDRVHHCRRPAVPRDHAGIAGLTTAAGIEDRPIEDHEPVGHGQHGSLGACGVGVLACEFFDLRHRIARAKQARPSSTRRCRTAWSDRSRSAGESLRPGPTP